METSAYYVGPAQPETWPTHLAATADDWRLCPDGRYYPATALPPGVVLAAGSYTRVYWPRGHNAHLLPDDGSHAVLCEVGSPRPHHRDELRGTGSQEEYDRAAAMPACAGCEAIRRQRI